MSEDGLPSPNIAVFDQFALEYDQWFIENSFAYLSETEAIRRFIPDSGVGIEIGASGAQKDLYQLKGPSFPLPHLRNSSKIHSGGCSGRQKSKRPINRIFSAYA